MNTKELILLGNRRLTVEESDTRNTLRLVAPNGEVEVTIEVGPSGPTVRLRAVNLEITAERDIAIAGARVSLAASEYLTMGSGGDIELVTKQGSIHLQANDDVSVDGERILLNSPSSGPAPTWEQFLEKADRDEA